MKTKRSKSPKKSSSARSKSAKLVHARKKAKARMDQWVDDEQFITLYSAGIQFVGQLSRIGDDPNGYGDFLFKTAFGVSSTLFLLIFDQISFEEIAGMPEQIRLSHSQQPNLRYLLESTRWMKPQPELLAEVNEQFRQWTKLKTPLGLHFGDLLRITGHRGLLKEPQPETFLFDATEASTIHIIHTAASHTLEIKRNNNRVAIMMHNRITNLYVIVSDASDSPDTVFERFTALTKRVQ